MAESTDIDECNAKYLPTPHSLDSKISNSECITQHALAVLSSLKSMWKNAIACDFTIKVGGKKFPVHKALLIACSDYFKGMFSSDMKESVECSVDMKDVEENAIENCINYIYSGEIRVTEANVVDILQAASMIQLSKPRTACLDFLGENICDKNCILTWRLSELYDCQSLQSLAGTYLKLNFHAVVSETEFRNLSKDDALRYIEEFGGDDDLRWEASLSWMEHSSECFEEDVLDFFSILNLEAFPSFKLLRSTWKTDYFRKNNNCCDRLFRRVFYTVFELSENITVENCFLLSEMAYTYKHTVQEIRSIVFRFMLKKFPAITAKKEFGELQKNDVIALLESPDSLYFSSEKIKWNAAVRWMKTNSHATTSSTTFYALLKTFDLKQLPRRFLQSCFFEPFVKESPECQQLLMDAAIQKPITVVENFVALLSTNKSLDVFEMNKKKWYPLHYSTKTPNVKMVSMNGNLCLLDGKHLSIAKDQRWVAVASLLHEPSALSHVVSCGDYIYVIEKGLVSCYRSLSDSWKEIALPEQYPLETQLCVAGGSTLYFVSPSFESICELKSKFLENLVLPATIHSVTSVTYFKERIYVYGNLQGTEDSDSAEDSDSSEDGVIGKVLVYYSLAEKAWHTICCPNNNSNMKLCIIGNNLAAFCTQSAQVELEIYNEKWNEWMHIPNTPEFKFCGTLKNIETVCSFHA